MGVDKGITGELDGFTIDLLGIPESADGATVRSVINAYTGEDFTKFVHNILLAYD
jgi:hypothetical protein